MTCGNKWERTGERKERTMSIDLEKEKLELLPIKIGKTKDEIIILGGIKYDFGCPRKPYRYVYKVVRFEKKEENKCAPKTEIVVEGTRVGRRAQIFFGRPVPLPENHEKLKQMIDKK